MPTPRLVDPSGVAHCPDCSVPMADAGCPNCGHPCPDEIIATTPPLTLPLAASLAHARDDRNGVSYWLKNALLVAASRDPVDALSDARELYLTMADQVRVLTELNQ